MSINTGIFPVQDLLPAMIGASLSPDKHSAGSAVRRYEYFSEVSTYLPVAEPIPRDPVE